MFALKPPTPVPNVDSALGEVAKAGWLSSAELQTLRQRLGADGLTGFADVALNGLKKPVLLAAAAWAARQEDEVMADPVGSNTVLLLPDAAQVKRRVDGYVTELLDGLSTWVGAATTAPAPATTGAAPPPTVAQVVEAIRAQVPAELGKAYSTPNTGGRWNLPDVIDALEQAVAGSLAAIMNLLGIDGPRLQPWDFSVYAPATFAGPARPSFSIIEQASAVYHLSMVGGSLRLGPVTAALVPGVGGAPALSGVPGHGDGGYPAAYGASLTWLRGLGMAGVGYGVLVDLAHLFALAATTPPGHGEEQVMPGLITGDWAVIETLGREAGCDMSRRAPNQTFYDYFKRTGQTLPFTVTVATKGKVNVYPIDAPRNPDLAPTQMRQLAQLSSPSRVTYGTQVRLRPGQPDEQFAYVYGYDTSGRPKVLWSDGETLELLDNIAQVSVVNVNRQQLAFAPADQQASAPQQAPMPSQGPHPAFPWNRAEYTVDEVRQRFPGLGEGAAKLGALLDRPVAEHPEFKISQYGELITRNGFDVFIVGGAVRDILLGIDPNDIDLASTMPAPDTYQAIVTDPRGLGKKSGRLGQMEVRKNLPFGTVQVEPNKVTGLDIIATHDTAHGSSLSVDVDAYARDFTVNTIYYNPVTGTVIDPTGKGLADLASRQLRFVLDLEPRILGREYKILEHDLVLIGRWIKFVAKKFTPQSGDEPKVLAALVHHQQTGVDNLVRARFIDRSGLSPTDLVARAAAIDASLGQVVKAIVFPGAH